MENNQVISTNNQNTTPNLDADSKQRYTLYSLAYVFMIVSTVIWGFFILPLLWMIPMTIMSKQFMNDVGKTSERQHIAFGVCALIFCGLFGLVAGILILIASANFNKQNLS